MKKKENYPDVTTLGDGRYHGIMSGYVFEYNGRCYKCSFGIRGLSYHMTVIVENGQDRMG